MEEKCTTLEALVPDSTRWWVKVFVAEKTPIRNTPWAARQQRLVFIDREKTRMQCIIHEEDVDKLDKEFQLHHTYYVAPSTYQMVLSKSSLIRPTPTEHSLLLDQVYQMTSFAECPHFADDTNQRINILGAIIHAFPPRRTQKKGRPIQDFVIVNQERRPMILSLLDDFLQHEAPHLTANVQKMPVILGMRFLVNTFHGISVGTALNSTILFDPPLPEVEALQLWIKSNMDYVHMVVSHKLYNKQNQIAEDPLEHQIRRISEINSLSQNIKAFWIIGGLKITKTIQEFYLMTCPECSKTCGADYGDDFRCLHCGKEFPQPVAIFKFQVDLFDGTGSLTTTIEDKEAEALLGISAATAAQTDLKAEADKKAKFFTADYINERFTNLKQLFHIRSYSNDVRGKSYTYYTIEACLPASNSVSPFLSLEEKGSSSAAEKTFTTDISMPDHDEATSSVQKEHVQTDLPRTAPIQSSKRSLESAIDPEH